MSVCVRVCVFVSQCACAQVRVCGLRACVRSRVRVVLIDDRLYSAILRSLEQTPCARMWFYMSD